MPPVIAIVPAWRVVFPSARVTVRLAVNVVGVSVTPKDPVPPALPVRITASCVAADRTVTDPPVAAREVPVAAPTFGVTRVGVFANTNEPDPVSSVTALARLALVGVARNVATLAPSPDTPVEIGRPVQEVRVPEDGVPSAPPFTTKAPAEPTFTANAVATPVPSPETPVEIGRPVQFVNVPEAGIPRIGVVSVGEVARTTDPEPVTALT